MLFIMNLPKKSWPLLCIILIGGTCKFFTFSFVYLTAPNRILSPDSASYIDSALSVLQTGTFSVSSDFPKIPQVERTPGYPLFIASILGWGKEQYFLLILSQLLVSLGTIYLCHVIARHLWSLRIANITTLFLSLDIISFVNAQKVLAETLFTFSLCLTAFAGITLLKRSRHSCVLTCATSILLALTTLVRPITYYLVGPFLLVCGISWRQYYHWPWKKILIFALLFLVPWTFFIGGWHFRNYWKTGYAEFTSIEGINLFFYRGADIIAQRNNIPLKEAQERLGYKSYLALKEWSPQTKADELTLQSRKWKKEGVRLIQHAPLFFLKSQLRGAFSMLFETDWNLIVVHLTGQYKERSGPGGDLLKLSPARYIQKWLIEHPFYTFLFWLSLGYLGILYLGVISSVRFLIKQGSYSWPAHLFLWTIIGYLIAISAGPEAYSRFRVPLMPFFSLYAGHGISILIQKFQRKTS